MMSSKMMKSNLNFISSCQCEHTLYVIMLERLSVPMCVLHAKNTCMYYELFLDKPIASVMKGSVLPRDE